MIEILKNKEQISIVYEGKGVSINDFYSQGHWTKRNKIKKEYKPIFSKLINSSGIPEMDSFAIIIEYNSRHDPDNVTGIEKLFVDTLKDEGRIIDDSKKYYKFYGVTPNLELKSNTFIFNIYNLS